MRDALAWSRMRLAEQQNLEPWEPSAELNWAERHGFRRAGDVLRSSWEACRGRMLPHVIELDGGSVAS